MEHSNGKLDTCAETHDNHCSPDFGTNLEQATCRREPGPLRGIEKYSPTLPPINEVCGEFLVTIINSKTANNILAM